MLIALLKNTNVDENRIIGIALLLQKSEDAMIELGMYIEQKKPTEEQILMKAVEIHDRLPKELQTAE